MKHQNGSLFLPVGVTAWPGTQKLPSLGVSAMTYSQKQAWLKLSNWIRSSTLMAIGTPIYGPKQKTHSISKSALRLSLLTLVYSILISPWIGWIQLRLLTSALRSAFSQHQFIWRLILLLAGTPAHGVSSISWSMAINQATAAQCSTSDMATATTYHFGRRTSSLNSRTHSTTLSSALLLKQSQSIRPFNR